MIRLEVTPTRRRSIRPARAIRRRCRAPTIRSWSATRSTICFRSDGSPAAPRADGIAQPGATYFVREKVMADPSLIGKRISILVPFSDDPDQLAKGRISAEGLEAERRVSDKQIEWFQRLEQRGMVEHVFNKTCSPRRPRSPELAGIWGALVGTFWTMLITIAIAFPLAGRRHLPGGVRAEEPMDGVDRGEHQQSRRSLDRLRLLGWRCSSTSSAFRARRRWSAAWCCR